MKDLFREKKNVVRLILFLLAVILAVGAFTAGVMGYLHRDSGYYDVDYSAKTAPVLFDSGVHLKYYGSGSSAQIRAELHEVQEVYSDTLLWLYQQLDAEHQYEGVVGLAALNAAPGQWVQVDAVLETALGDALERTRTGEGYSVFAGPLYREWQALRYLEEPENADPANNPEEQAILEQLAAFIGDPSAFSLEIEEGRARLTVSEAYQAWARENEIDAPVLDFGLLRDAYLLDRLAQYMRYRGYTSGYLYTDSGLSLQMALDGDTSYQFLGLSDGEAAAVGAVTLPSPSAFCQFTAFSLTGEKYGYYTLKQGGVTLYRHPWIDLQTGGVRQVLLTAALGGKMTALTDLAYDMIRLNECADQAEVNALLKGLSADVFASYTLQNDDTPTLYVRNGNGAAFEEQAESGFRTQNLTDR